MIDEKRLAELRKTEYNVEGTLDKEILDTLEASLRVVKAAQKLDQEFGGAILEMQPSGERTTVREWTGLKEALAPFDEQKKK